MAAGLAVSLNVTLVIPIIPFCSVQSPNGASKELGSTEQYEKPLKLLLLPGLMFCQMSGFSKKF